MDNKPIQSSFGQDGPKHNTLSVFNNNHHFAFIYKKTEKIVTAIYMITNFIKDNDLLKLKIRELSLELLSLNLSFVSVSLSERKILLKEYEACSIEIISLTGIAHHSGLISEMNYQVLKREFDVLIDLVENGENKKMREETVVLPHTFFDVDETENKSVINPHINFSEKSGVEVKDKKIEHSHFVSKVKRLVSKIPSSTTHQGSVVSDKKNSRQEVILGLLNKNQGLNIKDFSAVISGCSEKTIQRELTLLVSVGTLRKEGERRWSKYYLV